MSGRAVALLFVMVTVPLAVPPAATEPKSSDVGDAVIAPVGKLARFCGSIDEERRTTSAPLFPVSCVLPFAPPGSRSYACWFAPAIGASTVPSLNAEPVLKPA